MYKASGATRERELTADAEAASQSRAAVTRYVRRYFWRLEWQAMSFVYCPSLCVAVSTLEDGINQRSPA